MQMDGPVELDPDIARLQAQAQGNSVDLSNLPVPPSAFVAALNGLTGTLSLAGGSNGGLTITISLGASTITVSITGNGSMATKNVAAAVADSAVVAGVAYVQADFQAVIDKLNALLQSLRAATHIAT